MLPLGRSDGLLARCLCRSACCPLPSSGALLTDPQPLFLTTRFQPKPPHIESPFHFAPISIQSQTPIQTAFNPTPVTASRCRRNSTAATSNSCSQRLYGSPQRRHPTSKRRLSRLCYDPVISHERRPPVTTTHTNQPLRTFRGEELKRRFSPTRHIFRPRCLPITTPSLTTRLRRRMRRTRRIHTATTAGVDEVLASPRRMRTGSSRRSGVPRRCPRCRHTQTTSEYSRPRRVSSLTTTRSSARSTF